MNVEELIVLLSEVEDKSLPCYAYDGSDPCELERVEIGPVFIPGESVVLLRA